MINIADALSEHSAVLRPHPTARLDTELLIAHCLQVDRTTIFREPQRQISRDDADKLQKLVALRKSGKPLAQLIGKAEFFSLELHVTDAVLTPRADTELIVSKAIELIGGRQTQVLDLGTGSGAIGIAVAAHCPNANVFGFDISAEALHIAGKNRAKHALNNFQLLRGKWLSALADSCLDMVLTNPPYVETHDRRLEETEIAHEPRLALDGGIDGMQAIQQIIPQAFPALRIGGYLLLEHGYNQAQKVTALLSKNGFSGVQTLKDLSGHDRVSLGQRT